MDALGAKRAFREILQVLTIHRGSIGGPECGGAHQDRVVITGVAFIADAEAANATPATKCPLDGPWVATKSLGTRYAAPGFPRNNSMLGWFPTTSCRFVPPCRHEVSWGADEAGHAPAEWVESLLSCSLAGFGPRHLCGGTLDRRRHPFLSTTIY